MSGALELFAVRLCTARPYTIPIFNLLPSGGVRSRGGGVQTSALHWATTAQLAPRQSTPPTGTESECPSQCALRTHNECRDHDMTDGHDRRTRLNDVAQGVGGLGTVFAIARHDALCPHAPCFVLLGSPVHRLYTPLSSTAATATRTLAYAAHKLLGAPATGRLVRGTSTVATCCASGLPLLGFSLSLRSVDYVVSLR